MNDKLKNLAHAVVANKAVIGKRALQVAAVGVGYVLTSAVLSALTRPTVTIEGDIIVESTDEIITETID